MPSDKLPALPPRPKKENPRTLIAESRVLSHMDALNDHIDDQNAHIVELVSRNEAADKWIADIYKIIGKPSTSGAPLPSLVAERIAELEREIREARDKARKEFGGVITELAANKSLLKRDDYNLGWNDGVDKAAYFIRKYMNGRGLFQDDRRNAERENGS